MKLEPGEYIITSKATNGPLARSEVEETSLLRKAIVLRPISVSPPRFKLAKSENDHWVITLGGKPLATEENRLWAFLDDTRSAEEWIINEQTTKYGIPNLYTITNLTDTLGWAVPNVISEAESLVSLRSPDVEGILTEHTDQELWFIVPAPDGSA
ncbi:hypothetical protein NLI96_g6889 [Meripilus lineatus]|uniref:Uncharacterized protein n=1 Tax=Meripilus lineatus TaxID=2056292 RepID=A0AAD5V1W2_9APHY|nr:hypothetical protein NLI96_g6889 [Physisporinus lineatus]